MSMLLSKNKDFLAKSDVEFVSANISTLDLKSAYWHIKMKDESCDHLNFHDIFVSRSCSSEYVQRPLSSKI